MTTLDLIDRKIVAALMRDATQPIGRIADQVGLSQTPCWKRIQKLEATGVLTGRVALADPAKLGLGLTVFSGVEAPDHSPEWRAGFESALAAMPEVREVYRMAGVYDYLLQIVARDVPAFDAFYKRLTTMVTVKSCSSLFVLERLKATPGYPLDTSTR
ncbi:Lrp/AsnC family transcriptional regulator [Paracoccus sp. MC1862]|uniref:Lrp/AsnC family transcriptional regulator n=1 Tax=Paracoccus sp. MC1862 TaxID=2760307 RepID=UPI0015FF2136|nr:Lrp/AsnC family transcriptional regulator [Paracoccus sp. MC1862]MBB1498823.1 Lrp/AsnC family transcriptional regulator [Paracoccus sp. MC1862]QQO43775.1 Lrp/AsnC family transcriptional regulator [Paracoccus sp. MC1862]